MRGFNGRLATRFALGASALAMAVHPGMALAQDASSTVGATGPSRTPGADSTDTSVTQSTATTDGTDTSSGSDVVVTGIRASLRRSIDLKRDAQGVVDAI